VISQNLIELQPERDRARRVLAGVSDGCSRRIQGRLQTYGAEDHGAPDGPGERVGVVEKKAAQAYWTKAAAEKGARAPPRG